MHRLETYEVSWVCKSYVNHTMYQLYSSKLVLQTEAYRLHIINENLFLNMLQLIDPRIHTIVTGNIILQGLKQKHKFHILISFRANQENVKNQMLLQNA